jgi:hypothetical protein
MRREGKPLGLPFCLCQNVAVVLNIARRRMNEPPKIS